MTVDQIDRVDPELLPLLQVDEAPPLPITRETLHQVRARSAQRIATRPVYGTTQPRLETITTPDGGLDLYIFEPHPIPSPKPCLIWLHGGGYIMGQAMDMWNGPLFAERTGCTVVSVEY